LFKAADTIKKVAETGEALGESIGKITQATVEVAKHADTKARNIAELSSNITKVVSGAGTVADGGLKVDLTVLNQAMEKIKAMHDANIAKEKLLLTVMRDLGDHIKQSMKLTNESYENVSNFIA